MTTSDQHPDSGPSGRRILGSASWAALQQVVTLGGTAVSGVILARVLTLGDFGAFSYATTLAGMGMTIMTAGLSGLAIKSLLDEPSKQRWTMTALVLIREVAAILAYAALLSMSLTSGSTEVVGATAIALIVLFARAFDATEFWFQSRVESRKTAGVRIISVVVFMGLRVWLALSGAELVTFLWLYVLESVATSIGLLLRYRFDRFSPAWGKPDLLVIKGLVGHSWMLLAAGIAAQINSRGDILVLQGLLGSGAVGLYSAAARLSELFYFLPVVLVTAAFPSLLSKRRILGPNSASYGAATQRYYDLACWGGIAVAVFVYFAGPGTLTLLFGDRYAESGQILQVHVFALPLVSMAAVFSKWIVAEELYFASLKRHVLGAAVNIGLNFALIPHLGIVGAAYATVASYFVASFLSCFFGSKTRVAGVQMAKAFVAPVRYSIIAIQKNRGTES